MASGLAVKSARETDRMHRYPPAGSLFNQVHDSDLARLCLVVCDTSIYSLESSCIEGWKLFSAVQVLKTAERVVIKHAVRPCAVGWRSRGLRLVGECVDGKGVVKSVANHSVLDDVQQSI